MYYYLSKVPLILTINTLMDENNGNNAYHFVGNWKTYTWKKTLFIAIQKC